MAQRIIFCNQCGAKHTIVGNVRSFSCNHCGNTITCTNTKKSTRKPIGCMGVIAIYSFIVALFVLISVFSEPAKNRDPVPSTTIATAPKITEFSQDSEENDEVYIDILTIKPVIGVRPFMEIQNRFLVCECTTPRDETVWVYIFIEDYYNYFDSIKRYDLSFISDPVTITFSEARRIYGHAETAESIVEGLSQDIHCEMVLHYSHQPDNNIN